MIHNEIIFRNIYDDLWMNGKEVSPRGQLCKEIENFHVDIPPYARFVNFEARKFNLDYCKTEYRWYLRGDDRDLSIADHAKLWKSLIHPNGMIYSNYGKYIFADGQFDRCMELLIADKDTRRATISILQPYHILDLQAPEIPCTNSLSFRIRNNILNMTVKMRSTDAIYGFGNDLPTFSFIHEMMLMYLNSKYQLELGTLHFSSDSFHVYSKHYQMVKDIINYSKYFEIDCPRLSSVLECESLRGDNIFTDYEDFKFYKWLNSKEV